jgi:hypothetical protein
MPLKQERRGFLWSFKAEITLQNSSCAATHQKHVDLPPIIALLRGKNQDG